MYFFRFAVGSVTDSILSDGFLYIENDSLHPLN